MSFEVCHNTNDLLKCCQKSFKIAVIVSDESGFRMVEDLLSGISFNFTIFDIILYDNERSDA